MKLVGYMHLAEHYASKEGAEAAAKLFASSRESAGLGDWDYRAQRHREGWIVKLETPLSEGRVRGLGWLSEDP